MKKLYFSILIFFLYSFLFPEGISVTSPNAFDSWGIGDTKEIEWRILGETHPYVKIRLFDKTGRTKILDITDRTPNNRKFKWILPQTLPEGKYIIRVKTFDNNFFDDSMVFNILDRRLTKINLISPSGGERFGVPGHFFVSWDMKNGQLVETMKLIIKKGGEIISTMHIDNILTFSTTLPSTISAGNNYTIRLEDVNDPSIFDESGNFEIFHTISPNLAFLKQPQTKLQFGDTMSFKWRSEGFDKRVNIELLRNNSPKRLLARSIREDFFNWEVYKANDITIGDNYQIRISATEDNNITIKSRKISFVDSSFFPDIIVYSRRILEKETFIKGDRINIRFTTRNPSDKEVSVEVKVNFYRGRIKPSGLISTKRILAIANTNYTGEKYFQISPDKELGLSLPVTIKDQPGDYTVIISVLPSAVKDPKPRNNTIYGYYKVVLKALSLIKKK